jgi:hypothetical protein
MPYEYIVMLYMALVPPLFYYVMDPRVKSINDAKDGIENPDQWNNEQPMSKDDEARHKVVIFFLATVSLGITGLLFL